MGQPVNRQFFTNGLHVLRRAKYNFAASHTSTTPRRRVDSFRQIKRSRAQSARPQLILSNTVVISWQFQVGAVVLTNITLLGIVI